MPPRPSSGQSDSGSTNSQARLSHSPMAPTQGSMTNNFIELISINTMFPNIASALNENYFLGGYQQQPLAPPQHMQNFKMAAGGPQGPHMIPNPSSGPPYSQMPPSHQAFNQQGLIFCYCGRKCIAFPLNFSDAFLIINFLL